MGDATIGCRSDVDEHQESEEKRERKAEATSKETLNELEESEGMSDSDLSNSANKGGARSPVPSPDGELEEKPEDEGEAGPM
jgi:hypothetical protein